MRERYQLERHLVSDICSFPSEYNEVLGVQKENKILQFYKTFFFFKKKQYFKLFSHQQHTVIKNAHLTWHLQHLLLYVPGLLWHLHFRQDVFPSLPAQASPFFPLGIFSAFLTRAFLGLGSGSGGTGLADNFQTFSAAVLHLGFIFFDIPISPSLGTWWQWGLSELQAGMQLQVGLIREGLVVPNASSCSSSDFYFIYFLKYDILLNL